MRLSHDVPVRSAVFDEPNLVSHAGMVPVVRLAGSMRRYSRQLRLLRTGRKLLKLQVSRSVVRPDPVVAVPRRVDRRLADVQRAGIAQQYRDGIRTTALCREHGLSKSALLKLLADAGVQMRRQPMTDDQVERAHQLYESGLSFVAGRSGAGCAPSDGATDALAAWSDAAGSEWIGVRKRA